MSVFFFNDTATTEIYTLSLHDALPISEHRDDDLVERHHEHVDDVAEEEPHSEMRQHQPGGLPPMFGVVFALHPQALPRAGSMRSEEHTSELQSRQYLVCRLLLEKHTNQ